MARALLLSTTGRDPRWDDTYEELAFTAFALATQADDPQLAPLLTRVRGTLADWERIESDRRRLRGAAIAARATVRVADAALDLALGRFADALLASCDGNRESASYRRFFPERHESVIELGLDGEIPAASLVLAELDEGGEAADTFAAYIDPLRRCVALGHAALAHRADSYADLGRAQARVEAWLESADGIARGVHSELTRLGEERGVGYRWTASFFLHGTALA